jgi:hypothetical protein
MLGPFRGGRVDTVSGVPGRPNEFYFGAVNGGVWKTIDAGRIWFPVFDSQPVASIGALAVAPSAPDTIYVGSGESTLRDSVGYGNGMYKSTDAGKTWTHIGLDDTQHIGKVAVDPRNPNVVFVAAIGHLYEANADRGVFRSRDGGKTWQKVLFKNDNIGAVDVVIDPVNSQVVYAALWNTRRPPWYTYQPSNGPGGGVFKSTDGGSTWSLLTGGLPTSCVGRVGLAVAPSNPRRVYAVVDDFLPEGAAPNTPCPGTPPGRGGGAGAAGAGAADASAYRDLVERFAAEFDPLMEALLSPLASSSGARHPWLMASFGLTALRSASGLTAARFRSERARAMFAGAAAHSMVPLDYAATAGYGLGLILAAHAVGWPVARGGAQKLADALASYLRSLGGEIVPGQRVESLARPRVESDSALPDRAHRYAGKGDVPRRAS